ncbi:uncharacterized protein LOC112553091 [Pogonomyrmex barbatus]|uniref:Uncharacterized protein LOC112553091 n=1 Tax=Pogonomyrmex barbatus TaxID=144034 RepID=A0A8N1SAJ9_9HYME|nr:uncharacterized protein LOC112553091 [Pogonomyrmex barbatus]
MQHERFVVKYVTANNCFAYLSVTWLRRLETKENAIEISHNGRKYYLSCVARINNDETLCIGATFARSLNIQEGDEVFVSSMKNVPSLKSINIAPRTASDRELLELQIDKVQSNLLNQVRIVARGQPIVAWISKFSSVTFIAGKLFILYNVIYSYLFRIYSNEIMLLLSYVNARLFFCNIILIF